jgi:hypothetical protein
VFSTEIHRWGTEVGPTSVPHLWISVENTPVPLN